MLNPRCRIGKRAKLAALLALSRLRAARLATLSTVAADTFLSLTCVGSTIEESTLQNMYWTSPLYPRVFHSHLYLSPL
jgi:hypothetical protein